MSQQDKPGSVVRDPIAVWDDILDLVAEDDAETGEPSEEDQQWSQRMELGVKSRLAELRRRLTPTAVPVKRGVKIPSEIQALARPALVAKLELLRKGANVRYAHQDLTGLSDNDLRTMLAILLAPTET
ncbi:MAG: hypothetical protein ABIY55_18225 [Kofleriaceae bacterium]|jgi:hypothetical protein